MRTISVPRREQVDKTSQELFDALQGKLGMVPNIYAVTGYSSEVLDCHLTTTNKVGKGSFSNKELEAIRLAVSEVNACSYCLAAHSAIAKMNGFTDADALALRKLNSDNPRLRAITRLAADIVSHRGKPSQEAMNVFFEQGYSEKAVIDLVAVIVDITFTNYMHGVTKVPIDFPEVAV